MRLERQIVDIPVGQIEHIDWARYRRLTPEEEPSDLDVLGHSMHDPKFLQTTTRPNGSGSAALPTKQPAQEALSLLALHLPNDTLAKAIKPEDIAKLFFVGQVAPIQVLKYPPEIAGDHKPYGCYIGHRRIEAAKRTKLPTIRAQVLSLTYAEYKNDVIGLWIRLQGFIENETHKALTAAERLAAVRDIKDRFEMLLPTSKVGRPAATGGTAAVPVATPGRPHSLRPEVLDPEPPPRAHAGSPPARPRTRTKHSDEPAENHTRIDRFLGAVLNRDPCTIRWDITLVKRLAAAVFDLVVRQELSHKAARHLIGLPEKQQINVLQYLRRHNLAPTATAVRQAVETMKQEQTPTTRENPLVTPTACNHCDPCAVKEHPDSCPQMQTVSTQIQTAIILLSDLHLRTKWTQPMVDYLLRDIGKLATAAQGLELNLRDPQFYVHVNPLAVEDQQHTASGDPTPVAT